jgi:cold shock CspA family protein
MQHERVAFESVRGLMRTGIVRVFLKKKGFGFIADDLRELGEGLVFCRASEIQCSSEHKFLVPGESVSFRLKSQSGRYHALDITALPGEELCCDSWVRLRKSPRSETNRHHPRNNRGNGAESRPKNSEKNWTRARDSKQNARSSAPSPSKGQFNSQNQGMNHHGKKKNRD